MTEQIAAGQRDGRSLGKRDMICGVSRHFAAAAVIGLCIIPATAARAQDEDRNDQSNRYVITNLDYNDLFQFHKRHKALITIGTYKKNFKIDLGIIRNASDHHITDYIEKPLHIFQVSMGIYVFEREFLFDQLRRDSADAGTATARRSGRSRCRRRGPVQRGNGRSL